LVPVLPAKNLVQLSDRDYKVKDRVIKSQKIFFEEKSLLLILPHCWCCWIRFYINVTLYLSQLFLVKIILCKLVDEPTIRVESGKELEFGWYQSCPQKNLVKLSDREKHYKVQDSNYSCKLIYHTGLWDILWKNLICLICGFCLLSYLVSILIVKYEQDRKASRWRYEPEHIFLKFPNLSL